MRTYHLVFGCFAWERRSSFLHGAPRARSAPGVQVKAPDPKSDPLELSGQFGSGVVDAVLATTSRGLAHRRSISADSTPTNNDGNAFVNFQGGCLTRSRCYRKVAA